MVSLFASILHFGRCLFAAYTIKDNQHDAIPTCTWWSLFASFTIWSVFIWLCTLKNLKHDAIPTSAQTLSSIFLSCSPSFLTLLSTLLLFALAKIQTSVRRIQGLAKILTLANILIFAKIQTSVFSSLVHMLSVVCLFTEVSPTSTDFLRTFQEFSHVITFYCASTSNVILMKSKKIKCYAHKKISANSRKINGIKIKRMRVQSPAVGCFFFFSPKIFSIFFLKIVGKKTF